ncbi:histone protein [Rutstroemia sp. NJR-2017a BVV2]|nr:histone protein [Rutstroemia sp. NJR-2017a BVV2]
MATTRSFGSYRNGVKSPHKASKKSKASKAPAARKSYRFKPGTVALREIRKFQASFHLLIPKVPFGRLIREITYMRFTQEALAILQEAAEGMLVDEFYMTNLCAIHAKRVTIQQKDMQLVQALRRAMTGYSFPGRLD